MKNWRRLILGLTLCIDGAFATPQIIDQITAIVENSVVLESDINHILNTIKQGIPKANQQLPDDGTLLHQILDQLIMDNISLQLAQQTNTTISDTLLDQSIWNIAAKNHMTLDQLRSRLDYDGIDYDTYRAKIRKKMLIAEVLNSEIGRRVTILPQEVESLANQMTVQTSNSAAFNLSYILIPLPKQCSLYKVDQAEDLAHYLVKKSKSGVDFSTLKMTYSTASQALKYGQMSWDKLEELPSPLSSRLQNAQQGDIIGPILAGVGFYILKVNDILGVHQTMTVTEMHARHILLHTSVVVTDQQARAKLEDIAQKINSNRITFSVAAKQLSEDPESANQGGDLGWSSVDTFDPELRNVLMQLKKGEISSSVHSSYGWHLVQLLDTRQVDRTDAAQKDLAYRLLFNRKFAEEKQTWMQEHRASTYIKILNNNEQ